LSETLAPRRAVNTQARIIGSRCFWEPVTICDRFGLAAEPAGTTVDADDAERFER